MIRALALVAALAAAPALAAPAPKAPNREADLLGLDAVAAARLGGEIGMDDISPDPRPSAVGLLLAPSAAFTVQPVGLACTGQRVRVDPAPLAALLARPGAGPASATLRITAGRAFRRCVSAAEFRKTCLTTVELGATLETPGAAPVPLSVAVTRDHDAGARCLHMEPASALATREAVIALLAIATASSSAR